ncbi:uncharacterized protein LOC135702266 [Ochlerotatus camptorhynchus]|uniref:uncharacterized protein LOC135702266 n=1 Tax=Ochlerotatus camptorhynchus TaxID=644619 RepID=UPI0031DA1467
MDVKSFRIIGLVYVVFCWMFSALGIVYSFLHLVVVNPFWANILSYDDAINSAIVSACLFVFTLSSFFVAFVKEGIDEGKASFIRIYRVFVILRNLALSALWTYQYAMLEEARIHGDASSKVRNGDYITLGLFVGAIVITGLELWILNGIQWLTEQKLVEEECTEAA